MTSKQTPNDPTPPAQIFAGEVITVSSSFSFSEKKYLQQAVQERGGSTSYLLNKKVTYYVTSKEEVLNDTLNVRKAFQYSVRLVTSDFVRDSVKEDQKADPETYSLSSFRVEEVPFTFSFSSQPSFFSASSPLLTSLWEPHTSLSFASPEDPCLGMPLSQESDQNGHKGESEILKKGAKTDDEAEGGKRQVLKDRRERKEEERAERVARLLAEKERKKAAAKLDFQQTAAQQKEESRLYKIRTAELRIAAKERKKAEYEQRKILYEQQKVERANEKLKQKVKRKELRTQNYRELGRKVFIGGYSCQDLLPLPHSKDLIELRWKKMTELLETFGKVELIRTNLDLNFHDPNWTPIRKTVKKKLGGLEEEEVEEEGEVGEGSLIVVFSEKEATMKCLEGLETKSKRKVLLDKLKATLLRAGQSPVATPPDSIYSRLPKKDKSKLERLAKTQEKLTFNAWTNSTTTPWWAASTPTPSPTTEAGALDKNLSSNPDKSSPDPNLQDPNPLRPKTKSKTKSQVEPNPNLRTKSKSKAKRNGKPEIQAET